MQTQLAVRDCGHPVCLSPYGLLLRIRFQAQSVLFFAMTWRCLAFRSHSSYILVWALGLGCQFDWLECCAVLASFAFAFLWNSGSSGASHDGPLAIRRCLELLHRSTVTLEWFSTPSGENALFFHFPGGAAWSDGSNLQTSIALLWRSLTLSMLLRVRLTMTSVQPQLP